jgi:ABC-type transport system substrate-binding protein
VHPSFRGPSGARRRAYSEAQRLIAEDVPYVSPWYKTNVAVYQPDLQGVRLSPITFLEDVHHASMTASR